MISNGTLTSTIQDLQFDGADVWLFMGVILLVVAMIFKKGIEIQSGSGQRRKEN
jgi:lipoprotein signal peptidase